MNARIGFRTVIVSLAVASLAAGGATIVGAESGPTLVQTDKGAVQGTLGANGVRVFEGIPFAAPPIGANRFAPPQPAAAWTTPLVATAPAPPCPQMAGMTQNTTEDCLYLNVWAPADVSVKRPVLVFLYGGGFTQGNAAAYEGRLLAERNGIVVVTPNYRNGLFGFLASPALDTGKGDTGNYALEDQQAALRWVRANIAQFGGDPNNVTLGGESAGAMSTCMQVAAPAAAGLFHRAIVESGPCAARWPTLQQQEATLATIPAQLGCSGSNADVAACLRSGAVTIQRLLALQATLPRGTISPSVGGSDLPQQPRGAIGRVPLLLGGNALEAGYLLLLKPPADDAAYEAALTQAYAGNAPAVAAHYPYAKYPNGGIAISTVQTDWAPSPYITWCEDVRTFELMRSAGRAALYAYEFNDPNSYGFTGVAGPVHTAELPYLFANWGNVYPSTGRGVAATSQGLSDAMLQYWGNFVKTGNPNAPGLPPWPVYHGPASVLQLVPHAIRAGVDVDAEHQCPFWNSLGFAL